MLGSRHFIEPFVLMLNLLNLLLDINKDITNSIATRLSAEKIEPFGVNFAPTMTNLENRRVTLKFNNLILVEKSFSSL